MISEQISTVKTFMSKLLIGTEFDRFYVTDISITTNNTYNIDGHIHKDFYSKEEYESLGCPLISKWNELKPFCYQIIKGHHTPLKFKIIFKMPEDIVNMLLNESGSNLSAENVSGFFLNIKYENDNLTCITGTSLNVLDMSKDAEKAFDKYVLNFIEKLS